MHSLCPKRLCAVILIVGASFTTVAAQSAFAVEPVAIAQTTSAVSSQAFLGTPAPLATSIATSPTVLSETTSTLVLTRTGTVSPAFGALVLIAIILIVGAAFLWRRRKASQA